jgi:ribosomal protein L29
MDPLPGLMKTLGTPGVISELKKTIAEGVSQMDHSVEQLAQEENRLLVDLIKLRVQQAKVLTTEAHA